MRHHFDEKKSWQFWQYLAKFGSILAEFWQFGFWFVIFWQIFQQNLRFKFWITSLWITVLPIEESCSLATKYVLCNWYN